MVDLFWGFCFYCWGGSRQGGQGESWSHQPTSRGMGQETTGMILGTRVPNFYLLTFKEGGCPILSASSEGLTLLSMFPSVYHHCHFYHHQRNFRPPPTPTVLTCWRPGVRQRRDNYKLFMILESRLLLCFPARLKEYKFLWINMMRNKAQELNVDVLNSHMTTLNFI